MKLLPNPDISIRKIDTEIFIYDRNHSLIHTFNETGVFLWEAFSRGNDKSELVRQLQSSYEVDEQTAATDIDSFFQTLESVGLAIRTP